MTNDTKVSWTSVIVASIVATVVVTITFMISGNNIVKALGMMILGNSASTNLQYLVGGAMHLAVGIAYGILFALFFAPVRAWNKFIKGILFGFVITAVALTLMPVMATVVSGAHAPANNPCVAQIQNPCNPGAWKAANPCAASQNNPCNPCAGTSTNPCGVPMQNPCGMNPCNPCAGNMANPCGAPVHNPCASGSQDQDKMRTIAMVKPGNPCAAGNPCAGVNPCVGANPCGGGSGGNAYVGLISLLNHLAFGLTLAFLVRVSDSSD